jgi:hypothetical protein
MKYARVQDTTFIRDLNTTAILQTDPLLLRRHETRMRELEKDKVREDTINSLKQDVQELKDLLKQLLINKSN